MIFELAANIGIEFWQLFIIIVLAGFLQGFINTMAGAGTIITYTLFVALGMPANMVNGTVRIGVIAQTLTSSFKFNKSKTLDLKKAIRLAVPIVIGSVFGSAVATGINKELFELLVGILLSLLLITMWINPKRWIEGKTVEEQHKSSLLQNLLFLGIGFYGGFIHIGVGIFLLSALVLNAGYDVVKANAIKVFLVMAYIPVSVVIFIISGQIDIFSGIIVAVGNVAGGFIGANMAIKKGASFVRTMVMIIIVLFVLHLFGVWRLLFSF